MTNLKFSSFQTPKFLTNNFIPKHTPYSGRYFIGVLLSITI